MMSNLILLVLFALISVFPPSHHAAKVTNPSRPPANAVLLSKVQTLTLRSSKLTSSRRVSAVPQLQCVGPRHVCELYTVDVMRCVNSGYDYSEADVQWTCTANLPDEFELGSTDVSCEGYESSEDPFVLKGSCGVEYRLLLTSKGRERFGSESRLNWEAKSTWEKLVDGIFWLIFFGVIFTIALAACGCFRPGGFLNDGDAGGGGRRGGGGGGGGGGGNDWHDDPRGPPPPYDYQPRRKPTTTSPSSRSSNPSGANNANPNNGAWRPGFWSGALGGAAAGYFAGNRQQRRRDYEQPAGGGGFWGTGGGGRDWDRRRGGGGGGGWFSGGGGGRSASYGSSYGSSSSSGPSFASSSRHESTGFGGTRRR